MNLSSELQAASARHVSRRWFLRDCGVGLASIALAQLLTREAQAATRNPLAARAAPLPVKAKRVIFLFQAGGPSHLELFDNKPELTKRDGQLPPADMLKNYRAAFINPNSALLAPKFKFQRHGQSGLELSELLPHLGKVADELCVIKSMQTDAVNHAPAQIFMNTGSQQFGRPSLGAWSLYGLGSEAENLPGYVVLSSAKGTSGGASNWGCGFLPTIYGGTPFRSSGDPILYLSNPKGLDKETQRASLDALEPTQPETLRRKRRPGNHRADPGLRNGLQTPAERSGLDGPFAGAPATLERYGCDPKKAGYARNCLLARRLVERGVRFVQLFHEAWDQHGGLATALPRNCRRHRPGHRCAHHGLEAAGFARRHARHLGWRIRPHPHGPGRQRRAGSPQPRFHHAARRRRGETRLCSWRNR
jgi:hypothetical protein